MSFPMTHDAIRRAKEDFHAIAGFPNVVGAIDGTLIGIKAPSRDEHLFVSRKGGHAINVLAVCDADKKFIYANSKYPGATNDAFIWANCELRDKFDNGDIPNGCHLLGNSGYVILNFANTTIM